MVSHWQGNEGTTRRKDDDCTNMRTDDVLEESTTKEETETMIFEENEYRSKLAMDAPISSTDLIKKLGNLADTEIAQHRVEGSYEVPDKIDEATAEILKEIRQWE